MSPHLIPHDHPIKPLLDLLFSQSRLTESKEALVEAGFTILYSMPRSYVIVASHPQMPGYVFKMHLDSETEGRYGIRGAEWLTRRCMGAADLRKFIQKKHIQHFTVPDKWLYVLPLHPRTSQPTQQPLILVETDMEIETNENTVNAWKTIATKTHLKELHSILKRGYGSPHLVVNVPYTKNGVFAFIDTEKPTNTEKLRKVKDYFSPEMAKYWLKLIDVL